MIIRLVTMTFEESHISTFLTLFEKYNTQIRSQPGCQRLELIQDLQEPNKISTLSKWDSQSDLNNYRNSELFGQVWPETKKLFLSKPKAQSFDIITSIN